jgi:hypothetical protein
MQVRSSKPGILVINSTPVAELGDRIHNQIIQPQKDLYILFFPYDNELNPIARRIAMNGSEAVCAPGNGFALSNGNDGVISITFFPDSQPEAEEAGAPPYEYEYEQPEAPSGPVLERAVPEQAPKSVSGPSVGHGYSAHGGTTASGLQPEPTRGEALKASRIQSIQQAAPALSTRQAPQVPYLQHAPYYQPPQQVPLAPQTLSYAQPQSVPAPVQAMQAAQAEQQARAALAEQQAQIEQQQAQATQQAQAAQIAAETQDSQAAAYQTIQEFLTALAADDISALSYLSYGLRLRTNLAALSTFFGAYNAAKHIEQVPPGANGLTMELSYPFASPRIFAFEMTTEQGIYQINDVRVYGG